MYIYRNAVHIYIYKKYAEYLFEIINLIIYLNV